MREINIQGIRSEVRECCKKCNPQKKIDEGIRAGGRGKGGCYCNEAAKKCPFVVTSNLNSKGEKGVAAGAVFKKYGLKTLNGKGTYLYGKSHLMVYLNYPELEWKPPEIPEKNRYGQLVDKERDIMTLSHQDGDHYNDSKDNLLWLLKSEHGIIEPNITRREDKVEGEYLLKKIEDKVNYLIEKLEGIEQGNKS